jgi:4-hydroxythreonine-4-phosphate dehydrogenase
MLPILLTMGDPAGIGGEIMLRAAAGTELHLHGAPLVVIDDPERLRQLAARLNLGIEFHVIEGQDAVAGYDRPHQPGQLTIWKLPIAVEAEPGQPSTRYADAVIESINLAVAACLNGHAAAMTTSPIAKEVLARAGFRHPGHTEYLGYLAETAGFPVKRSVMMLAGPKLRTVPVTVHVALANVPLILSQSLIIQTAEVVNQGLKEMFGIAEPRLALSGLNPHAGENGLMGGEENRELRPAIDYLQRLGIAASGPHPADTMFTPEKRESYDVALCMYHDQALIPVKTLDMDRTVNVTLGLPFIRTSPDHGTAFDIAGKGIARPDSLIAAVNMAAEMATKRAPAHAS